MAANDKQISGTHYKQLKPEPWDVVAAWDMGYLDGSALKYIARWRYKNDVADLQKAIHFLEKLIEVELAKKEDIHRNAFDYEMTKYNQGLMNGTHFPRSETPSHP